MKKFVLTLSIIILIFSFEIEAKSLDGNKKQMTNTLGEKVSMNDIIDKNENNLIVIFWDSNNRNHINVLEELNYENNNQAGHESPNIIAICSDKYHNYQQLNTFVSGKDCDIDVFVDVNNSFKRSKGLSDRLLYAYKVKKQTSATLLETKLDKSDLLFSIP